MLNTGYLLPPLIVAGIGLTLLIIVLLHRPKEKSHWLLSLILMSITFWAVMIFAMRSSPSTAEALSWDRRVVVFVFAVPLFYYHFSLAVTKTRGLKGLLYIGYFFLVGVLALSPTDLLVQSMEIQPYGYAPIIGRAMFPIAAFAFFLHVMAIYKLFKAYLACREAEQRNRLLYITIAIIFPLFGAVFELFPTFYPTSIFSNIVFGFFATLAIIRYHLLDIRVIARKSLVYLIMSAGVAVPYVGVLILLNHFLKTTQPWWLHAFTILVLAVILQPLYRRAQQLVDRMFYRDRYDYLRALEQFSQNAQSIISLEMLGSKMVDLVSGALRTQNVCLLLRNEERSGFTAASCSVLSNKPSGVVIRNDSPVVKWLQSKDDILSIDRFDLIPQLQSISLKERKNIEIMEAALFVPIRAEQKQLTGIIVLGEKLSQQSYSWEDKRLLSTVSNQMSMALENGRLYEQAKQSERVLRESEEKLRLMYESMVEGVIVTDLDGLIIQVNESAVRMHDYEAKEQLLKRNITGLVDTTDREKLKENIQEALRGKNPSGVDIAFRTSKAEQFPGELSISLLRDTEGNPAGFIMVSEDVTERKKAEEREKILQAELNLSSRLASVGELAAGVAHEINNPLTGIMGFSQRLLRKTNDEAGKRDLERILGEATRAARVVENLRTFARRREPKKEEINIHDVLKVSIEMRTYELKTSNIDVITDLAPELPPVMADFHQIQQVFLNIIMNAEQAIIEAQKGGVINIKTRQIYNRVQVSFADDGSGISEEYRDNIFDPFFTTRGEKGGTGLGLSICHGIITDHGGKIRVESIRGKGTTFFIELPATIQLENKK